MKRYSYIVLIVLLINSCNNHTTKTRDDDEIEIIKKFYLSQTSRDDFSKYYSVILINECGSCLNCNNAFALAHSDEIEDDSVLFIISSCGVKIDISPYIIDKRSNVIWDSSSIFEEMLPLKSCKKINLR